MGARRQALLPEVKDRIEARKRAVQDAGSLDDLLDAIGALERDAEAGGLAARAIEWTRLRSFGGKRPPGEGVLSWDASRALVVGEDGLADARLVDRPDAPPPERAEEAGTPPPPDADAGIPASVRPLNAAGPNPIAWAAELEAALRDERVAVRSVRVMIVDFGAQLRIGIEGREKPLESKLPAAEWLKADAQLARDIAAQIAGALLE